MRTNPTQRVAQKKKGEYNKPVDIDVTPAQVQVCMGGTPDLT